MEETIQGGKCSLYPTPPRPRKEVTTGPVPMGTTLGALTLIAQAIGTLTEELQNLSASVATIHLCLFNEGAPEFRRAGESKGLVEDLLGTIELSRDRVRFMYSVLERI